jgi:hypothetical protein
VAAVCELFGEIELRGCFRPQAMIDALREELESEAPSMMRQRVEERA